MALNLMVSLKYETNELSDCISLVSGIDLCKSIKLLHSLSIISVITFIGLTIFYNKTKK